MTLAFQPLHHVENDFKGISEGQNLGDLGPDVAVDAGQRHHRVVPELDEQPLGRVHLDPKLVLVQAGGNVRVRLQWNCFFLLVPDCFKYEPINYQLF